jgi:hypothetical protein
VLIGRRRKTRLSCGRWLGLCLRAVAKAFHPELSADPADSGERWFEKLPAGLLDGVAAYVHGVLLNFWSTECGYLN